MPHMEYDSKKGWKASNPKFDPLLHVTIKTCKSAYKFNNLNFRESKEARVQAIADTGARTTVAGLSLLHALGLTIEDLFPVEQKLCSANNSKLTILRGLFVEIKQTGKPGEKDRSVSTMCYNQKDCPEKIYLSLIVCEQLSLVSKNFPSETSNLNAINDGEVTNVSGCACPKRENPPLLPDTLPHPPCEANREILQR